MDRTARSRRPFHLAGLAAGLTVALLASGCSAKQRDGDQVAGKQLFVKKCGSCHVLGRAGTKGVTGPNLDEAFHQGLSDGLGSDGVRGVVRKQIAYPSRAGIKGSGVMPANLAEGKQADDIASYVAAVVSKGGKDTGLLANAVPTPGAGKPLVAKNGTLDIAADPNGGLLYDAKAASSPAGPLTIKFDNASGVPHNVVIDGKGKTPVIPKGSASFKADLTAGKYTYYCSVPGHRQAGMVGTLTVK
jgi:plastocyanin